MNDRSFNRTVIGSVIAGLIIVVFVAYLLAAVVRTSSDRPTQTSIGPIFDDRISILLLPSVSLLKRTLADAICGYRLLHFTGAARSGARQTRDRRKQSF
jgi:hypothetical protein